LNKQTRSPRRSGGRASASFRPCFSSSSGRRRGLRGGRGALPLFPLNRLPPTFLRVPLRAGVPREACSSPPSPARRSGRGAAAPAPHNKGLTCLVGSTIVGSEGVDVEGLRDARLQRFTRKEQITDQALREVVERLERGLAYADLTGGLFKERLGARGSHRVIVAHERGRWLSSCTGS
jgi:hypothetical protein